MNHEPRSRSARPASSAGTYAAAVSLVVAHRAVDRALALRGDACGTIGLPGWKLHPLTGKLKDRWAVWASGN